MEVLCGFARWLNGWHNWWPAGQLGENGEYWMGRKESGLIWYSELQGGSPCLCWLRHASVDPYWTSSGMYNWIVSGHPRCVHRGIYVEDGTRARYDPAQLFDSIVNCCHSWCLWAYVCHVVRFIFLHGWLLIWISVTPSDMGDCLFSMFKHRIINFIIMCW
jgi:hypothetical protein